MSATVPIAALLRAKKKSKLGHSSIYKNNDVRKKSWSSLQAQIEALERQIEDSESSSDSKGEESCDDSTFGDVSGDIESLRIQRRILTFLWKKIPPEKL